MPSAGSDSATPDAASSARLGQHEPKIGRAELGQLALQPQPVQPQPQVMLRGQHEPQLRRAAHHQQLQLTQCLGRAQFVQVIDDQPDPILERGEILRSRSAIAHPSRSGATANARTSPAPGAVLRSAASTDTQHPLRVSIVTPDRHPRAAVGLTYRVHP
jgi:hypothetical protein